MKTNHKILLAGTLGFFIGAVGVFSGVYGSEEHSMTVASHEMNDGTMMHGSMSMGDEMNAMTAALTGKTGDAFDQEFLSGMITHHQGAVEMAELALKNAKHQEIKDLAQRIITAQKAEIAQMQEWQKMWYGK